MKEKVEKVLDELKVMLRADGGDVELVDVNDGVVKVRLQGACAACPSAQMTLKIGIEKTLREKIPEIKEVIAV